MRKRLNKYVSLFLLAVFALSFSAQAADTDALADKVFVTAEAQLIETSTTLYLDFYVVTNTYNDQLGVSRIKLHDLTTGKSITYTGPQISGSSYDGRAALPATKGHRYYADVTFYADGYTKQVKTNTLTF